MPASESFRKSLLGALWMGGTVVSFCVMAVSARELLQRMGTFEVLFFRTFLALLILIALTPWIGLATLKSYQPWRQVLRNAFHFGGQGAWIFSIGALPLATVFAIEFTFPVWTAILAVLLLGEKMDRGRTVMLVLGFVGVMVILRPGLGVFHPAALVMLSGSFAFAAHMIVTKRLAETDSPYAMLLWMSLIQTPVALAAAWPKWVMPVAADWPWLAAIGICHFTAHFCLTRSLKLADASVVVPIDFFRLPIIAVIGWLLYREPLDLAVIAGAVLIFAGTYYSITRQKA